MTHSNFEKPEHGAVRMSEQFRNAIGEKVRTDIKHVVQEKVQQLYEERVKRQDLELAAGRIFDMVLQGADEDQIDREITSCANGLTNGLT